MGSGSFNSGIDVPNTVFTVCSRKSAYLKNPNSPQFRDIADIKEQYGEYFEIGEPKKKEWEHNGERHIGLEILMKKK